MLNTILKQTYAEFSEKESDNPVVERYNEIIKELDHKTAYELDNIIMDMIQYETQRYYKTGFLNGVRLLTDIIKKE